MKNIFSIFKLENLKNSILDVNKRFPISLLIIIIVSWLLFTILHWNFTEEVENNIIRSIFSLIVVFFLRTWYYMFQESTTIKKLKSIIVQIAIYLFWIWFFIWFDQNINNLENFIFLILSLTWIISLLFFAPYIKIIFTKKYSQSIYYTYFYNISVVFLTSFILWLVLFILWNIWIWAVFELFDFSWIEHNKVVWDWTIIALSIITPIFALNQLPSKKSFTQNHFKENIFFSFLIKYITIPFIYIYFIILYAYTIKVLSNFWEWPKGEVSWMVIWFSIFWYTTYIYSYIFEEKNKSISAFRKLFPYVVIPQIFMLAYAIYLRIAQYDITTNRYFVVVFWLWLLTISIYYILSHKKKISTIVSSLTLFIILISIWPRSIYNLPESRQSKILKSNLIKANILVNWKIIPLKSYKDIEKNLSRDIYSWIDYLCDYNSCNHIKTLFPKIYKDIEEKDKLQWKENKDNNIKRYKEAIIKYTDVDENRVKDNEIILEKTLKKVYKWISSWEIVNKITKEIKVETYYWNGINESSINFNINHNKSIFPIDTKWYSKILEINSYNNLAKYKEYAYINLENKTIEIKLTDIKVIDISSIFNKLSKLQTSLNNELEKEQLTFKIDNYKIILNNLTIKNPEYNWTNEAYTHANWYLLIK